LSLFDKKLVVVAGKGGVGRTTVSAALAVAAADKGKRVLLCQTKSKERLSTLFGVRPVGTDVMRVRDRVHAVNMTPQAALREYGAMVLRSEFIAKQVLENKVSRTFLKAIPGLEDYAMLGKVWFHTTEEESGRPRFDLVIMDAPATGHLLSMLQIPLAIIDTVPEGPLTRPAQSTLSLLRDPVRSSMVIVTLAEDLPSNEAIDLAKNQQATVRMPLGPLVVNQLYPPRFSTGPSSRAVASIPENCGDPELEPLLVSARTAQRRRALNERYLERLKTDLPQPQVHLPYLFRPDFGVEAVTELARRLEGQVSALG
jgi:hypothetical protein